MEDIFEKSNIFIIRWSVMQKSFRSKIFGKNFFVVRFVPFFLRPNLIFTGDIFEKSNIFKFIYYFSSWEIFLKN